MNKPNDKSQESMPDDGLRNPALEEGAESELHLNHRKRKRIKVRRRIRIKKRKSPKKQARKTMETIAWVLIIAAFIITVIILIMQLDLNDKRIKKSLDKEVTIIENTMNKFQFTV